MQSKNHHVHVEVSHVYDTSCCNKMRKKKPDKIAHSNKDKWGV